MGSKKSKKLLLLKYRTNIFGGLKREFQRKKGGAKNLPKIKIFQKIKEERFFLELGVAMDKKNSGQYLKAFKSIKLFLLA